MNRKMGREDLTRNSYVIDESTGKTTKCVSDEVTHDKLDQVIAGLGGSVTVTPGINNIAIVAANVEQSIVLPANVKGFVLRARGNSRLQVGFAVGESSTNFFTIPRGANYKDTNTYTSLTLYVQSNIAGDTLELITYT